MHNWSNDSFPAVITIFSAPNYCDVYNNKAAFLQFRGNDLSIRQFYHVPHPYFLPNHVDLFSWSIPFVAEKLLDIFVNMLKLTAPQLEGLEDDHLTPEEEEEFQQLLKDNPMLRKLAGNVDEIPPEEEDEEEIDLNQSLAAEIEGLEKVLEKKKELTHESE